MVYVWRTLLKERSELYTSQLGRDITELSLEDFHVSHSLYRYVYYEQIKEGCTVLAVIVWQLLLIQSVQYFLCNVMLFVADQDIIFCSHRIPFNCFYLYCFFICSSLKDKYSPLLEYDPRYQTHSEMQVPYICTIPADNIPHKNKENATKKNLQTK